MKTNITQLAGSAMLALLLTACGGGGGGGGTAGTGSGGIAESATTPQQMQAVVDQSNNFTSALCPNTVNGSTTGTNINPSACLSEAQASGTPDLTGVVASFCPTAAASFNASNVFDPAAFTAAFSNPQGFLTNGPLTFPVACLQEAATNMDQISSLIGANNPLTQQLCPNAAAASTFDPATCFSEIASGAGGGGLPGLPGLPNTGGSGGSLGGTAFLGQFCPQAAAQGTSAQTPMDCLNEASQVYITVVDMLTADNPLYDALCPEQAASGRVQDPVGCFQEALNGGVPSIPGLGDLPGLSGGGGSVPGLSNLTDQLSAICPNAIAAGVSPTTPIDCLTEAGQNLGGLENLTGGLGNNPLTQNLCPTAAGANSFDPAACFSEALSKLGGASGGSIPGTGMLLSQICPSAAAGGFDPTTTPTACLMELGGNFGNLQDVLGSLGGSNPLTGALCPTAAASGSLDPAACFTEALQNLPGGLPIPGSGNGGGSGLPGFDNLPLISQLCPTAAAGAIGPTTPVDCLSEAGGNLGQIQNLLGGLGGANPLTDALCPTASNAGQLDPAACLTEALGQLGNLSGAGGGQQIPGLSTLLDPLCPTTAAGGVGPTTPIACLTEAGGNLGQLQSLLGNLGGGANPLTDALCPNAGGDPAACLTEALGNLPGAGGGLPGGGSLPISQLCPNAAAAGISPTTPIDCLTELGGNLGQLQGLLGGLAGGGNPLTDALCPNAGTNPQACLTEALGQLGNLPGAGGTGGATIPGLDQICPNAAANIGPTTPIDCLSELGGNLGQFQTLLGGLAGGSNPLTQALCPTAAASGSFNPQACLTEAAGSLSSMQGLGQLQGLLGGLAGGSNPVTQQLCPTAAAAGTFDPVACFQEGLGSVPGGGSGVPVLGDLLTQLSGLLTGGLGGLGGLGSLGGLGG